jgi:hypothetical protein
MIGGVAVAIGLYLTAENLRATQKATAENLELIRDGQISDRYSRAVAMLGDRNSLEVRLGGIYALAGIAERSVKDNSDKGKPEIYYWPILMLYTDFLRERYPWNSPWKGSGDFGGRPQTADSSAILASIGKLNGLVEMDRELDLGYTYLKQAWLKSANFKKLSIAYVNLQQAKFINVQLNGSNLKDSCLRQAEFTEETDLTDVIFIKSNIIGANFEKTKGLKLDQLRKVIWDDTTVFPKSIEGCKEGESVSDCLKREKNPPRKFVKNDPCTRNYKIE